MTLRALSLLLTLFLLAVLCLWNEISGRFSESNVYMRRRHLGEVVKKRRREIMFFGDSLVESLNSWTAVTLEMKKTLELLHPTTEVIITINGGSGFTVFDLYSRVDWAVLKRTKRELHGVQTTIDGDEDNPPTPDAVVVFWDSDCLEEFNEQPDENERSNFRLRYRNTLYQLVRKLKEEVRFLAIAGPGLITENTAVVSEGDYKIVKLNQLFEDYEGINKNLADTENIDYIDLRRHLRDNIPSEKHSRKGYFTTDGEHLNERGNHFLKELFLKHIEHWSGLWTDYDT